MSPGVTKNLKVLPQFLFCSFFQVLFAKTFLLFIINFLSTTCPASLLFCFDASVKIRQTMKKFRGGLICDGLNQLRGGLICDGLNQLRGVLICDGLNQFGGFNL